MKNSMMLYGVTLGKRYTKRQKAYFVRHISEVYPKLGFPITMNESKSHNSTVCNMIAGDLEQADMIFAASYDTPSKFLLSNTKYYPFNSEKNIRVEKINLVIQIFLTVIFAIATYLFMQLFLKSYGFEKILFLFFSIIAAGCALFFGTTRANRFNFNRNSASLAVMEKIAEQCSENSKIAFAFIDKSVSSFEGIKEFQKLCKNSTKQIILLDSISYGQTMLLAHREKMNAQAAQLIRSAENSGVQLTDRIYSDDKAERNILVFSKHMLYLVSGIIEEKDFVVENTRSKKDIQVDMERLNGIVKALTDFVATMA